VRLGLAVAVLALASLASAQPDGDVQWPHYGNGTKLRDHVVPSRGREVRWFPMRRDRPFPFWVAVLTVGLSNGPTASPLR
jgi:hypothetical protein